jgi:hypothetical protein
LVEREGGEKDVQFPSKAITSESTGVCGYDPETEEDPSITMSKKDQRI